MAAGGTLCIPSDEERGSFLTESIQGYLTTHIFLTSITARSLDPSKLTTLRNIYIDEEKILKADVVPWLSCAKEHLHRIRTHRMLGDDALLENS